MGEGAANESARLERRLWMLRVAVAVWLVLVLAPLVLGSRDLLELLGTPGISFLLLPAVALHAGAMALCRRRPGLMAVAAWGALLFLLTLGVVHDALRNVAYLGRRPALWVGLVALSQLAVVVAAVRAWLLAASGTGPLAQLAALAGAASPFLVLGFLLTPRHGPGGPRGWANESLAIGDIRALISAEEAYLASNGGLYDIPECLASPKRCIPGYPASAPVLIDSVLGQTRLVRHGYERTFHGGPAAEPSVIREKQASPSSITSYAYLAVPEIFRLTGVRMFCGDSTGRICFTSNGSAPRIERGLCAPSSCMDLR